MEANKKITLEILNKQIVIFPSNVDDTPIVYLNTFSNEVEQVFNMINKSEQKPFTLVGIYNLDWNKDTSPWYCPPIFKNDLPYTGGANNYLKLLETEIIPKVESIIENKISYRILVGYSLSGLFSLYSAFNSDMFSKIGSISSSLWFLNIVDYVKENNINKSVKSIYLSLGDKESKSKNQYIRNVKQNTETIVELLKEKKVNTFYQLNQGNHYKDASKRIADGIIYLLNN